MPRPKPEPMWRRYLRFFGPNVAADVDDELNDHIARLESELRERGTPPHEIAAAVRERFGDPDAIRARLRRSDELRHRRGLRLEALGSLGQDIAYALRRLKQQPGFTAAVVVVLALGVGATTAMFSAVDAAMLRPLPFEQPEQIALIPGVPVPSRGSPGSVGPAPAGRVNWTTLESLPNLVARVAAYYSTQANLPDPRRPVRVTVGHASAGLFGLLGVRPLRGRTFSDSDEVGSRPEVAILSYEFWHAHFGGRDVLDSTIEVDSVVRTVVGVMPAGFTFPDASDLWVPLALPTPPVSISMSRGIPAFPQTIARLANGVSVARVNSILYSMVGEPKQRSGFPPIPPDARAKMEESRRHMAVPLQRSLVGDRRGTLLLLLGLTGVLLLIACANVTNLLLSQSEKRRREIALRAVLGASRTRLVRQLLTESVLLAVFGTAIGLAIAPIALRIVGTLAPPALSDLSPARVDLRVLAFAAGVALATGVGFGIWPALATSAQSLAESAHGTGSTGASAGIRGRARRTLLTAEVALTLMLMVGAGLMLRSLALLMRVDPGFEVQHAAVLEFDFSKPLPPPEIRRQRLAEIVDRLRNAPGVDAAGVVGALPLARGGPLSGPLALSIQAEGVPARGPGEQGRSATFQIASGGYFAAIGIPLLRGRTFTPADAPLFPDTTIPHVVIVSQSLADSLWPGLDPVGRWLSWDDGQTRLTVIGVVGDVHTYELTQPAKPEAYLPVAATPPQQPALVARGTLPPHELMLRMRDAVRAVSPSQAVYNVRTLDDVVRAAEAAPRTDSLLISLFGGLACLLAVTGIYGVVSYSAAQRRRELGIRAALGASARDLAALVSREMFWVLVVGLAIGLAGAWAASRVMQSLLFGVTTHDPLTFVLAPLALIVPAAIATLVPARRAARTNPVDVMREE